jgi:acyl dehydratase
MRALTQSSRERARSTLFGATIAHGYFTLARVLLAQVLPLDGFAMAANYGLEELRFPVPLPVGDRGRMRVPLDRIDEVHGSATPAVALTVEPEAGDKPVRVAHPWCRVLGEENR